MREREAKMVWTCLKKLRTGTVQENNGDKGRKEIMGKAKKEGLRTV